MVYDMTIEMDTAHGDACDAPDYTSWCDDCRAGYDANMAAHAKRNALTCSCTTNPNCPDHGDPIPVPTCKEQRDALFAHDPVATTLRAHTWWHDRNACTCGAQPTCEPPYYFNAGGATDWHALHVANQFTTLGLETAGDWRWVRVRVTAATSEDVEAARRDEDVACSACDDAHPIDVSCSANARPAAETGREDDLLLAAIAELRRQGEMRTLPLGVADWFEQYAAERGI